MGGSEGHEQVWEAVRGSKEHEQGLRGCGQGMRGTRMAWGLWGGGRVTRRVGRGCGGNEGPFLLIMDFGGFIRVCWVFFSTKN